MYQVVFLYLNILSIIEKLSTVENTLVVPYQYWIAETREKNRIKNRNIGKKSNVQSPTGDSVNAHVPGAATEILPAEDGCVPAEEIFRSFRCGKRAEAPCTSNPSYPSNPTQPSQHPNPPDPPHASPPALDDAQGWAPLRSTAKSGSHTNHE